MNIEDELFHSHGKLLINKEDDTLSSVIVDIELDPLDCTFNDGESVEIDTNKLTYIKLSIENLENLIELIEKSEEYFNITNKD